MPCLYWLKKLQASIREMNKVVLWLLQCIWLDFHQIPTEVRPNPFISDGRIASALTFFFSLKKEAATDLKNVIKIRRGWYGKIIMKQINTCEMKFDVLILGQDCKNNRARDRAGRRTIDQERANSAHKKNIYVPFSLFITFLRFPF